MKSVLVTKIMVCTDISGAHPATVKKSAKIVEDTFLSSFLSSQIPKDADVKMANLFRAVYTVPYDGRTHLMFDLEIIPLENE